MAALPGATPLTMPDADPTVAMPPLPELQLPPPGSLRTVVAPVQTIATPVIGDGVVFTVSVIVAAQPSGSV